LNDANYVKAGKQRGIEGGGVEGDGLQFVQIRYTDLLGKFLAKYVLTDEEHIHDIFRSGIGLDGSSVKGFANIDDSDMMLFPDRNTLKRIPLSQFEMMTVIADVYNGYSQGRSLKDPRYVSQLLEDHLAMNQVACQVGAEVECFVFDDIVFNGHNNGISKGSTGNNRIDASNNEYYDTFVDNKKAHYQEGSYKKVISSP
jgi:glutamine synthetase